MKKRMVAVFAIIAVLTSGILTYKYLQKNVTIEDGNNKIQFKTFAKTVDVALQQKNIMLKEGDQLNVALKQELEKNTKITIERAVEVTLKIEGKEKKIKTCEDTVGELLQKEKITLGNNDELEGAQLNTKIKNGLKVAVHRYKEEFITHKEKIPFAVEKRDSNNLERGKIKVVQEGKEGEQEIITKVAYVGDKEVSREVVETNVIEKPINKVVESGTAIFVATSRNGETLRAKKVMNMRLTAYTSSYEDTGKRPGDRGFGITASGMKARVGVVAVDPRVIPLGTRLYIEGYGKCIAGDTGGAIKGNKIDLYFNSRQEAKNFGVKTRKVYILE